jgi:hypothetical protein
MTKRVTTVTMASNEALTASGGIPTDGIDVGAYEEGLVFLKLDVTTGNWTPKIQAYDGTGDWYDIADRWGSATDSLTATPTGGPASDGQNQTKVWQLSGFGKQIRVYFTAAGGSEVATIERLVFQGKS